MKRLVKSGAVAAVVAALSAGVAAAAVVHDDGATDFNGKYNGVGQFDYSFMATEGTNSISFDLFGANSIDGQNGYYDLFTILLNGVEVFAGSFSMSGGGDNVVTTNINDWTWNTVTNPGGYFSGGVTTVSGLATLLNGANVFSVLFTSPTATDGQGLNDESWALNKLDIAPVPLPAGLPLLLTGLAGVGAVRLRKRQAKAL